MFILEIDLFQTALAQQTLKKFATYMLRPLDVHRSQTKKKPPRYVSIKRFKYVQKARQWDVCSLEVRLIRTPDGRFI